MAAALFIVGALVSIPSSLLGTSQHPPTVYLLTLLGLASGLVCLALPWERIPRRWFHLVGAVATLEVAVAVAAADRSFQWYYVFVALFAAYVFPTRAEAAGQVGLVCVAFLAPAIYDPDTSRETIGSALVAIPSLVLTALVVVHMHERLEAKQRLYRQFAEDALALAIRIGGEAAVPSRLEPKVARPSEKTAARHGRPLARRWALGMSMAMFVPFATVGLAVAGVSLPGAARAPFETLGVELPNQAGRAFDPSPSGASERSGAGGAHQVRAGSQDGASGRGQAGSNASPGHSGGSGSEPVSGGVADQGATSETGLGAGQGGIAPSDASAPTKAPVGSAKDLGGAIDRALRTNLHLLDTLQPDQEPSLPEP